MSIIQKSKSPTIDNVIVRDDKDNVWRKEHEDILKKWADKAVCFKLMHEKAHKKYWSLNAWFNIPIIIISTITGTGNFASGSFKEYSEMLSFIIGGFNIFAGILATISNYTGIAKKLEAHNFACISWDKYSRKIQIELSKVRSERANAREFIKQAGEDYDRLVEISPILPNDIIRWFSRMIETGKLEEDIGELGQCCNELFCFPCGCSFCGCFVCACFRKKKDCIDLEIQKVWKEIELPEVMGKIKPTEIAEEPEPETPPPLVVMYDKKDDEFNIPKKEKNEYDIYNLDMVNISIV